MESTEIGVLGEQVVEGDHAVIVTLPVILLQRYVVSGLTGGAVRG